MAAVSPAWGSTTLAVLVALALFSLGALIIAVSRWRIARPGGATGLWRAYANTAAIVAAVLLPAAAHPALFAAVVAAGAYRCGLELATAHGRNPRSPARWILAAGAAAAVWFGAKHAAGESAVLMIASALAIVLAAPLYARALVGPLGGATAWIIAAAFPLLAACHLTHLIYLRDGFLWVFLLYATVEVQDSMAFLFGRLFGRRPLLPRLSPRKTIEGAAAGLVFGIGTGAVIGHGLLDLAWGTALALALLLVAAGFCGDLFASGLKRATGIKDFPEVHPLHGGLLDIYDSTLFAAFPLSLAVWLLAAAS